MKNTKIVTLCLSIFIIFSGCDIGEDSGPNRIDSPPYVTIVNGLSENLSFIENHGDSLKEGSIQTGQAPNQIFKHNNKVYIVNSLSNSIIVYNYSDFSIEREFSTGTGTNPYKAVIVDDKIYVSAYLTHQLLIFDLDGENKETRDLEILNENNKTYCPYPQGIVAWNNYIFIACMYSEENGATETRDFGRVAVYSISTGAFTGYIEAEAKNSNSVYVKNNILYVISSGGYDSGFDETGKIEMVYLDSVDLDAPENIDPVLAAEKSSFGSFCVNGNDAWSGNLGKGVLSHYDTSTIPWTLMQSRTFSGNSYGMVYIPDITYAVLTDELYVTEFNGNKLYILDPDDLSIQKEYVSSSNNFGDAQFILLVE